MITAPPNWRYLCQISALPNWDLDNGRPVSRDLWWTAKLFYDRVVTEDTCWLLPFVSPGADGNVYFNWYYGHRKLGIEITGGLWDCFEKDGAFRMHSVDGLLESEAVLRVQRFYKDCLRDKFLRL